MSRGLGDVYKRQPLRLAGSDFENRWFGVDSPEFLGKSSRYMGYRLDFDRNSGSYYDNFDYPGFDEPVDKLKIGKDIAPSLAKNRLHHWVGLGCFAE